MYLPIGCLFALVALRATVKRRGSEAFHFGAWRELCLGLHGQLDLQPPLLSASHSFTAAAGSMPPPKTKKFKTNSSAASTTSSKLAQIRSLEQALLPTADDRSPSLNPLVDLLRLTTTAAEPEVVHKGVYACGRVFAYLAVDGRVGQSAIDGRTRKASEVAEGEEKVRQWLADRLAEWVAFCQGLLKDVEGDLRVRGASLAAALTRVAGS